MPDDDFIIVPGGVNVKKMASKQTYECYVCKRNGFLNVRVYLDGKTEDGKTIYKNEDMSAHTHRKQQANPYNSTQQQQPPQQQQPILTDLMLQVKLLHQKIDTLTESLRKNDSAAA